MIKRFFVFILLISTLVGCEKKEPEIFVGIVSEKSKEYILIDNIGGVDESSTLENRVEINISDCEIKDSRQQALKIDNILLNKIVEVSFSKKVAENYPDSSANGFKITIVES